MEKIDRAILLSEKQRAYMQAAVEKCREKGPDEEYASF